MMCSKSRCGPFTLHCPPTPRPPSQPTSGEGGFSRWTRVAYIRATTAYIGKYSTPYLRLQGTNTRIRDNTCGMNIRIYGTNAHRSAPKGSTLVPVASQHPLPPAHTHNQKGQIVSTGHCAARA
eukprot:3931775-Rhodomonas_salina.1